jgi:hypothetical protein
VRLACPECSPDLDQFLGPTAGRTDASGWTWAVITFHRSRGPACLTLSSLEIRIKMRPAPASEDPVKGPSAIHYSWGKSSGRNYPSNFPGNFSERQSGEVLK